MIECDIAKIAPYLEALSEMQPGQVGEATLDEGEKKSTIKRRLTTAATRLGKEITYRRSGEGTIVYEVKRPKETV